MPYIQKQDRPFFISLLQELRQYPSWRSPEEHAEIMGMIKSWLQIKCKENLLKKDGYVNFMCTVMIKNTHRTYHTPDEHKTKIWNSFDKETARTVRSIFSMAFEQPMPSYVNYERLYGLLSLMEAEFERRGWSLERKDIKTFFVVEKKYWLKRIAEYEIKKITENGDV
jgi:hypothetical protein